MSTKCCVNRRQNCQSAKVRNTPTFYHSPIFGDLEENKSGLIRQTPTFLSTALDTDGYQIKANNSKMLSKNSKEDNFPGSHCYRNESTERKQNFFYACCQPHQNDLGRKSLADSKVKLLNQINRFDGYTSKMRKHVEQMSDPVFNGYLWEPTNICHLHQPQQILNQKIENPCLNQRNYEQNLQNQRIIQVPQVVKQNIPITVLNAERKQNKVKNAAKQLAKKKNNKSKSVVQLKKAKKV